MVRQLAAVPKIFAKRKFYQLMLPLLGTLLAVACSKKVEQGVSYTHIIGQSAPDWNVQDWIHSEPLSLANLRGKAVLIRWWTGPGCPYCEASARILNDIYTRYRGEGLVVVGFYHEKSFFPLSPPKVEGLAKRLGMDFPVAVDPGWKTLHRYWLDPMQEAPWTSVSFLIDQEGIVRYIHPGGTLTKEDGERLEDEIQRLLEGYRARGG